jgi:hypothetical protein
VSAVSPETFSKFYGVKRASYEELFNVLGGEVWDGGSRLKHEFDFYYTDIVVADVPGLVNSLESKGGMCIPKTQDS